MSKVYVGYETIPLVLCLMLMKIDQPTSMEHNK